MSRQATIRPLWCRALEALIFGACQAGGYLALHALGLVPIPAYIVGVAATAGFYFGERAGCGLR